MTRLWVDVPEGYLFGFPKLYDPEVDGDMIEWIYSKGYPEEMKNSWVRTWPEETDGD